MSYTLPLIARDFSDSTKNRTPILPGVFAMVSKRLHSGYTKCNLWWTNALFNIMVALAMYELCAPPTMVGDAA